MSLKNLFGRSPERDAAHSAYSAIVAQAREPAFYRDYGVPDTLDGRFEMIALHAFLVLHRLRGETAAQRFGQALFDLFFADMDRALREMGTGDLSVGKQIGRMAEGFFGRIAAYQRGLAEAPELEEALRRNLYGTVAAPEPTELAFMARYLDRQSKALAAEPTESIAAGQVRFVQVELDFPGQRTEL
ncbi:MAG TPA: ubiquinol-cytochrome C chaperone family protein [Aliidongia sp.]|nr:ubiquinol-cytochrome C chaperone family protein [Aliidongia sp.]